MQIECPACAARYDVPDEVVRPGRAMRCARCGETWTPRAVEPDPEPAAALDMRPAEAREAGEERGELGPEETGGADPRVPLQPAAAPSGGIMLVAAWIGSALVLAAAVWAMWHFHHRIERAWPPSARLFAMFEHRGR